MTTNAHTTEGSSVDLYWLPLGAGEAYPTVRWSGRLFEALMARRERRRPQALFHSALEVRHEGVRFVIEMAPVWSTPAPTSAIVCEGAVGLGWLGRSRFFRYEVHRWADGVIPDRAAAVDGPQRISSDPESVELLLGLVPLVPDVTWGRDELGTGEMWNSNSLTSWLLARSGHDTDRICPPHGGRAPGWSAGLVVAARDQRTATRPSFSVGN